MDMPVTATSTSVSFSMPVGSSQRWYFDQRGLHGTFRRDSEAVATADDGTYVFVGPGQPRMASEGLFLEAAGLNLCSAENAWIESVGSKLTLAGPNASHARLSVVEDAASLRQAGFGKLIDQGVLSGNVYCLDNSLGGSGGALVKIDGASGTTSAMGLSLVWRGEGTARGSVYLTGGYVKPARLPGRYERYESVVTSPGEGAEMTVFARPGTRILFCLFQLEERAVSSPIVGSGSARAKETLTIDTGIGGTVSLSFTNGAVQTFPLVSGMFELTPPLAGPLLKEIALTPVGPAILGGIENGEIRGMKVSPGYMTSGRYAMLADAGFNTVRLQPEIAEYLEADSAERADMLADWESHIADAIAAGFRVHFQGGVRSSNRLEAQTDPVVWESCCAAMEDFARMIADAFTPDTIMIDIFNEPKLDSHVSAAGGQRQWSSLCVELWGRLRAVMPGHTLAVQGTNPRSVNTITHQDPSAFDDNTLFVIHAYDMGVWSHQGRDYPHMYGIPFPASDHPDGLSGAIDVMTVRVAADTSLSETEREDLIATNIDRLNYIFTGGGTGFSEDWIDQDWSKLDAWIEEHGLSSRQVYVGEFGVVSEYNYPLLGQFDLSAAEAQDFLETARLPFLQAVVRQTQARKFAGWLVHQLHGDFNIGRQTAIGTFGETLIPELEAFFAGLPAISK